MTTKFHFIRTLVLFAVVVSLISGCAAKGPSYTSVKATIPQLQSDKKVKCYVTSSKYRDCQVVGSCISTENIKNFAYGDALYMTHHL